MPGFMPMNSMTREGLRPASRAWSSAVLELLASKAFRFTGAAAIGLAAGSGIGPSDSDPLQAASTKSAENITVITDLLVIRLLHGNYSNYVGQPRIPRNVCRNNVDLVM